MGMQSAWENLSFGHRLARRKGDIRAFVVSAELFPPSGGAHSQGAQFAC